MKTSELTGAALDLWVAKAAEHLVEDGVVRLNDGSSLALPLEHWSPSTDWTYGGPIIERERIAVSPGDTEWWARGAQRRHTLPIDHRGPTPLVAAMRSFVASKFGAEVSDA